MSEITTPTESDLTPFGYTEGMDVVDFLSTFGFDENGSKTIEDFVLETFNVKL